MIEPVKAETIIVDRQLGIGRGPEVGIATHADYVDETKTALNYIHFKTLDGAQLIARPGQFRKADKAEALAIVERQKAASAEFDKARGEVWHGAGRVVYTP